MGSGSHGKVSNRSVVLKRVALCVDTFLGGEGWVEAGRPVTAESRGKGDDGWTAGVAVWVARVMSVV